MQVDTDVSAAALAEATWGAGRKGELVVYLTVGTGIGGGVVRGKRILRTNGHPEMGHIVVARAEGDDFPGSCPVHEACLEGMASGSALARREGEPIRLAPDHPLWQIEVAYLAQACATIRLVVAPHVLILGGGVMSSPGLHDAVSVRTNEILGGYLDEIAKNSGPVVVAPGLGEHTGIVGAFALAEQVLASDENRKLWSSFARRLKWNRFNRPPRPDEADD